jgi:hypothetical protein
VRRAIFSFGLFTCLLIGQPGPATAQRSAPDRSVSPQQQSTQDYQQRVTRALDTAKKGADALNERQKTLLDAINKAKDPSTAKRILDDLIASATDAVEAFGETSEIMKALNSLLSYIDDRQKNASGLAKSEPRWQQRVDFWKARAESIRDLRLKLLQEAEKTKSALAKLKKDREFIEDVIAGEGVQKAQAEMENALKELQALGASIDQAIKEAQQREITGPAS